MHMRALAVAWWFVWLAVPAAAAVGVAVIGDGFAHWPSELSGLTVMFVMAAFGAVLVNRKRSLDYIFLQALAGAFILRGLFALFASAMAGWFYRGTAAALAAERTELLAAGLVLVAAGLGIAFGANRLVLPRKALGGASVTPGR